MTGLEQLQDEPNTKCRLSFAYLVSLLVAFTVVGAASSLLYALNIREYRFLSSMFGRAEFDFGEYQGRLLLFQAVFFVPLSVIVGLPGMHLLHRRNFTATRHFASLGAGLGLIVGVPLFLVEMKPSWGLLSLLLGVVWALVYKRWITSLEVLAMRADAYTWARRAAVTVGVFELIGGAFMCFIAVGFDAGANVVACLIVGPLSVLPVATLEYYRPRWGGLWLIVGGVLFAYLIVFNIPHPNFRGSLRFDDQLAPLLLVSAPMLFLGAWLLVSCRYTNTGNSR